MSGSVRIFCEFRNRNVTGGRQTNFCAGVKNNDIVPPFPVMEKPKPIVLLFFSKEKNILLGQLRVRLFPPALPAMPGRSLRNHELRRRIWRHMCTSAPTPPPLRELEDVWSAE